MTVISGRRQRLNRFVAHLKETMEETLQRSSRFRDSFIGLIMLPVHTRFKITRRMFKLCVFIQINVARVYLTIIITWPSQTAPLFRYSSIQCAVCANNDENNTNATTNLRRHHCGRCRHWINKQRQTALDRRHDLHVQHGERQEETWVAHQNYRWHASE